VSPRSPPDGDVRHGLRPVEAQETLSEIAQRDEAVAHFVVGDGEDGVLGLIEDDVRFLFGLVGGGQDLVRREDQVPEGRLLLDDPRVVLDVGRSRNAVHERGDIGRAADLVEIARPPQLLLQRHEIDRVAALGELDHLVEDAAVRVAEEVARVDHFRRVVERVVVQEDGAQDGAFRFEVVRERAFGEGGFEVLSINGNTHLGGDDFDEELINYLAEEFRKQEGIDLRKDPMALQRLKEAAEKAKIELSGAMETTVNLPFITADQNGPKHLDVTFTRAKFEELTQDLTDRCVQPFKNALADAKLDVSKIDEVVMVGGSTRMPVIQELVKSMTGKDPHRGVNPDEVVAVGAAIQGAQLLLGSKSEVLLLDVTPLSLGIETKGGIMTKLIERNTTIPTRKSEIFSTAEDNQPAVEIHVLQGEREFARDNKSLGHFRLEGIAPAPRGIPQIEVTFDIDANGILNVSARDRATGREQKITITASSGLSKDEVERMVRDAERHDQEDRQRKEEIELRNRADSIAYQAERTLRDVGDKISTTLRTEVEDKIKAVRDALAGSDITRVRSTADDLENTMQRIGQEIYSQAGAANGTGPGAGTPGSGPETDTGTVEGEYREI